MGIERLAGRNLLQEIFERKENAGTEFQNGLEFRRLKKIMKIEIIKVEEWKLKD